MIHDIILLKQDNAVWGNISQFKILNKTFYITVKIHLKVNIYSLNLK